MTTVRIRPLAADGAPDGAAECIAAVRLVDARGRPMIGLRTTDGRPVTAYTTHTIPAGGPAWEVDLTPQSAIARADGAASYYAVTLRLPQRTELFRVQVPESLGVLELADLVAGAAVDPADIAAGRLLPLGGVAGQVLTQTAVGAAWASVSGTGDMQSLIYDPRGIRADTFDLQHLTGNLDGGSF